MFARSISILLKPKGIVPDGGVGQQVDVRSLSSGDFAHEEHQSLEEEYRRIFVG